MTIEPGTLPPYIADLVSLRFQDGRELLIHPCTVASISDTAGGGYQIATFDHGKYVGLEGSAAEAWHALCARHREYGAMVDKILGRSE